MLIKKPIRLEGVRQNNLKNITVEFPMGRLTVITGLSGSGKSSLAFDTLYAEGQRRYVESLSTYTRQFLQKMPKPDIDRIENIPPAIALEQRNHVNNSRSTVGTQTEIIDYLRILYARAGETSCIKCQSTVKKNDPLVTLDWLLENACGQKVYIIASIRRLHPADPIKKTKKALKAKVTKAIKKSDATTDSLIAVLRGQGYQRAYIKGEELIELDQETFSKATLKKIKDAYDTDTLGVVIDRIKVAKKDELAKEDRTRLMDSIDQAFRVGHGQMAFVIVDTGQQRDFLGGFACTNCGHPHREPEPNLFSFNSPLGACGRCSGFGHTLELDEGLIVPEPTQTIKSGAIDPFSKPSFSDLQADLFKFCEKNGMSIQKKYTELTPKQKAAIWDGLPGEHAFKGIRFHFEEMKKWKYKLHIRVFIRRYQAQNLCLECNGTRLNPEALCVKIAGQTISKILDMPIRDTLVWLRELKLTPAQKKIAQDVFFQVERRLSFLDEVGVGYLNLSRLAKTLSGGEFQRINLATQLGNGLCGTLYVLDEPSIGLHAADTDRLIRVLHRLRDQGNTVVVVEHDLEVIRAADCIIELGPLAGRQGGECIAQGPSIAIQKAPGSVTGKYLTGDFSIKRPVAWRSPFKRSLRIEGCTENNLQNINVEIPLDRLVVVTGMSGSGKSTLVHKTLYAALARIKNNEKEIPGKFDRLYGAEQINGVVLLDQSSIGKSSRSNPATYMKAWDEVRRILANQVIAMRRGYTPAHFSFNVDGGRCPVCKGEGEIVLDMHFMAEVRIPCEECDGLRFKKTILDIQYRNKNVSQILNMTVDEAFETFRDNFVLRRKFGFLRDVGLGYLQVGQSGNTLSGGESQRLKIASTLDSAEKSNLLYILDEPTTGLHLDDIKRLMQVLHDLVETRHSVLLIEHHLDIIAQADHVIDLGPGGGDQGGKIIAEGPPEWLLQHPHSITGRILREKGYSYPPRDSGGPRNFIV